MMVRLGGRTLWREAAGGGGQGPQWWRRRTGVGRHGGPASRCPRRLATVGTKNGRTLSCLKETASRSPGRRQGSRASSCCRPEPEPAAVVDLPHAGAPGAVGEIPLDGFRHARLEGGDGAPAELPLRLFRIRRVARVVGRPEIGRAHV